MESLITTATDGRVANKIHSNLLLNCSYVRFFLNKLEELMNMKSHSVFWNIVTLKQHFKKMFRRTFKDIFLSFATLTSVLLNDPSVLGCFEACWSSLRTSCPGEFIWRHEARVSQRSETHSATGPNRQPGDAAVVQAHPQPALRRKLQSPGTNSSITVMLLTFSLKERNTYLGMFLTSHVNKQITQYEFAGG